MSFFRNKKSEDLERLLSRIADLTMPNLAPLSGDNRSQNRCNRSLPVLIAPWEHDTAEVSECATAVTKDMSDRGISLILRQPFRGDRVVIGFWISTRHHPAHEFDPYFIVGEVRHNFEIGGGFWQIGIEPTERLDRDHAEEIDRLRPIAAKLVPLASLKEVPVLQD